MSVRVYVEGGGDQRATSAECRRGFAEFFKKAAPTSPQPRFIPCGGRTATFDRFKTALTANPGDFVCLLVDAEGPVAGGTGPWAYLASRDGWSQLSGTSDEQAHLMVQCMEAWLLADRAALAAYYGEGFHPNVLPAQADVEQIAKADVLTGLKRATRATKTKGPYQKIGHGCALLALIDPNLVRKASQHADRWVTVLVSKLGRDSPTHLP